MNTLDLNTAEKPSETLIRVIKTGACPSLSGRSTLVYQIGCGQADSLVVRLIENSGKGYFNKDWISLSDVDQLLVEDEPLTFHTLQALFKGQSINNGGFLLAVLRSLGAVELNPENPRVHKRSAMEAVLQEAASLAASGISLGEHARPEVQKGRKRSSAA